MAGQREIFFDVGFDVNNSPLVKVNRQVDQMVHQMTGGAVPGFEKDLNGATTGAKKLDVGIKGVNDKAKEGTDLFKKMGGAITGVLGAGAITGGLGALLAGGTMMAGVKAADDLNRSMNQLQASTGLGAENAAELKTQMMGIYKNNFGQSFDDIGKSMATVTQNMFDLVEFDQLGKVTQDAIVLRDTFDFDVNESTRSAAILMKTFGIESDQAFNMIAQGAQLGLNKNGDLLDTLNEYTPQFKSLGFTSEQMFNTLYTGAQNGAFSIDKVGDAVKEFNIRAKDGSATSVAAFQGLGLNASKMMQTFAAGGPAAQAAFTQVVNAIQKVKDPVQQNQIAVGLFGTQFEDLEKNVILSMGNIGTAIQANKGTMEELTKINYSSMGEAFAGIGRQLEVGLLIPLGEKLLPYANQFANWLTVNLPAAIDMATNAFNKIAGAITFLKNNWDIIMPTIVTFGTVILWGLVPAMSVWIATNITAAAVALAPWLPLLGIAALVAGIVAGAIWVWKNYSVQIKQFVGEATTWVMDKFHALKDWFMNFSLADVGRNIIAGLGKGMQEKFQEVKAAAANMWKDLKDSVTGFFGINSPSRLMMELGSYTMEGFAVGMENQAPRVAGAAATTTGAATQITPGSAPAVSRSTTNSSTFSPTINVYANGSQGGGSVDLRKQVYDALNDWWAMMGRRTPQVTEG